MSLKRIRDFHFRPRSYTGPSTKLRCWLWWGWETKLVPAAVVQFVRSLPEHSRVLVSNTDAQILKEYLEDHAAQYFQPTNAIRSGSKAESSPSLPMNHSPHYLQLADLLHQLHALECQALGDSEAADELRDQMDLPWRKLTAEEKNRIEQMAADLNTLEQAHEPQR